MKDYCYAVSISFGVATITLLRLLAPFLSPLHHELYHLFEPLSSILIPIFLDFAAVWCVVGLLLVASVKFPKLEICVWSALSIFLPWMLAYDCFALTLGFMPHTATVFAFSLTATAWIALIASDSLFRKYREIAAAILSFVAVNGGLMLMAIISCAWQARHLNEPIQLHRPGVAVNHARILWLVFDELSYRQVYEHRFPGLRMPAFDALSADSTVFTHTIPVGNFTDIVLPSLLTGQPIDRVGVPGAGLPLRFRNSSTGAWQTFDSHQTIFADALEAGFKTGIAGWFIPYCRILATVLDRCFWANHSELPGNMFPGQSVLSNAAGPLLQLVPSEGRSSEQAIFHQVDYRELLAAGDSLISDPSVNFLLIHMPIPHMPGIFMRQTGRFASSQRTYIDNLALADEYLQHVRQELEKNGSWDSITLVVMGDHSWRVGNSWRVGIEYQQLHGTAEEELASEGGLFDNRPAYVVKLPHQTTPVRIDSPYAALRTRDLFESFFTGQIETPQQLATWVQAEP